MTIKEYLAGFKPLSIHARFAIGLRIFERYIRVRGLEDESIWTFLADMWQFPLLSDVAEKLEWEKQRGELADFGLGDEIPEELEEELYTLAISEDYFGLWVSQVTELAWTNLLQGPQDEESMEFIRTLLRLSIVSNIGVPELHLYQTHLFTDNEGWGNPLTQEELESWQANPCTIQLTSEEDISLHYSEQSAELSL